MLRLLATTVIELLANAVGLLVAKYFLPDFSITWTSFFVVVAIFTAVRFILAPLIFKLSFRYVRALTGGIGLVTTLAGLLVTSWLTDGLVISGLTTWVIATLLVWLFGVIAAVVLPLFLFKKALASRRDSGPSIPPLK